VKVRVSVTVVSVVSGENGGGGGEDGGEIVKWWPLVA